MTLAECRFPELAEPFSTALREGVRYILERFEPLGIIACGTIIRGNPDPSSDHDIYVLVAGSRRQRIQRFFNAVPAEIFVNPPSAIERYFEEGARENRPVTAHMIANGFVVLDRDPCVQQLCALAAKYVDRPPDFSETRIDWLRYAAALFFEDAVDVAAFDPETSAMLLDHAVTETIRWVFFARHNRPVPRFKDLLASVSELEPETGALARRFFAARDADERMRLAGELADRILAVRGFFEWESEPEEVG